MIIISWSSWSGRMDFVCFRNWFGVVNFSSTGALLRSLAKIHTIIRVSLHTILTPWWLFDHTTGQAKLFSYIYVTLHTYMMYVTLCSMYHCTVLPFSLLVNRTSFMDKTERSTLWYLWQKLFFWRLIFWNCWLWSVSSAQC